MSGRFRERERQFWGSFMERRRFRQMYTTLRRGVTLVVETRSVAVLTSQAGGGHQNVPRRHIVPNHEAAIYRELRRVAKENLLLIE